MSQRLKKIGKKLNITDKDLSSIKKAGFTCKIGYWILGAGIAVISFILGFLLNKGSAPSCPACDPCPVCDPCPPEGGGYPYSIGFMIPVMLLGRSKRSKIIVLLVSAVAFLVAIKARPVFGEAILYNVYKR